MSCVPEVERMMKCASSFHHAANLLSKETTARLDAMGPGESGLLPSFIPLIVLRAFTLEVLLKCLKVVETAQPYDEMHDLKRLFDGLSSASQGAIDSYFAARIGEDPVFHHVQNQFPGKPADVRSVLAVVRNAFVQWRYIFEKDAGDFYGVDVISHAVRRRIVDLRPDLAAC